MCPTFSLRHCGLPTIRYCLPAITIPESIYTAALENRWQTPSEVFLPGDILLKEKGESPELITTHPHPFYTPIATFGSEYALEPVAYGLKFAGGFSDASFIQGDFSSQLQATGVDATAYAAKHPGGRVAVP